MKSLLLKINKPLQNEQGFTLMEIVISIGILAIISGFILQMFLVSSAVNQRAKDTDKAAALAMTATETLKKQTSLANYLRDPFFRPEDLDASGGALAVRCYDKSWRELQVDEQDKAGGDYPDSVSFVLTVSVRPQAGEGQPVTQSFSSDGSSQTLADHTGRICLLTVSVVAYGRNVEGQATQKELARYDASKYFAE